MGVLSGGVFGAGADELTDLRRLANAIGERAHNDRSVHPGLPDAFDATAWQHLQDAGLTRLASTAASGGGPAEAAVVLRAMARHAVTVPIGETDLLANWLASAAGVAVPASGPLTIAIGNRSDEPITIPAVPYAADSAAVVLALRDGGALSIAVPDTASVAISKGHNAGGEPRDVVCIELQPSGFVTIDGLGEELVRRGAWVRCVQIIGALDAAVERSATHTRQREQFGRPLNAFQAVQHTLAEMAGDVERARAAVELAVAAAADYGFDSPTTDYAVTVAKVTLGQVVPPVVTAAHQLHGAIGVTLEHRLWLATMRARCWVDEFGSTADYAQRLGRLALSAPNPWDIMIGAVNPPAPQ